MAAQLPVRDSKMKGVLFDLDGTLLDTLHLISLSFHHAVTDVLGHDCSMDAFSERLGEPLAVQMADYAESPEQLDAIMKSYRAHNAKAQYTEIREFEGMREALEAMKQDGWLLGIATSKLHGPAQANLDIMKLDHLFDCIVGADDVPEHKPSPQPVQAAAAALGLDPGECFYVGDSPYDIQSGNGAGTVTVAVHWGQHPIERLRGANPTLECTLPSDLPQLVNSYEG